MVRWSELSIFLLLTAALAGCIQEELPPEPEPPVVDNTGVISVTNQTPEPVQNFLPVQFNASRCNAAVLLATANYEDIDHFLPAGFTPADVLGLLKLQDQIFLGKGAMGIVAVSCESNTYNGKPLSLALPGTLVYTPLVAGIEKSWVDGYEGFIGISDPEVADLFETYGWAVDRQLELDIDILPDVDPSDYQQEETHVPGAVKATVTATWEGAPLFDGEVVASAAYHTSPSEDTPAEEGEHIRFWHDSPAGLLYIENDLNQHGRAGGVVCNFHGAYTELFQTDGCGDGDGVGLVISAFDLSTTLVRLEGVHA